MRHSILRFGAILAGTGAGSSQQPSFIYLLFQVCILKNTKEERVTTDVVCAGGEIETPPRVRKQVAVAGEKQPAGLFFLIKRTESRAGNSTRATRSNERGVIREIEAVGGLRRT